MTHCAHDASTAPRCAYCRAEKAEARVAELEAAARELVTWLGHLPYATNSTPEDHDILEKVCPAEDALRDLLGMGPEPRPAMASVSETEGESNALPNEREAAGTSAPTTCPEMAPRAACRAGDDRRSADSSADGAASVRLLDACSLGYLGCKEDHSAEDDVNVHRQRPSEAVHPASVDELVRLVKVHLHTRTPQAAEALRKHVEGSTVSQFEARHRTNEARHTCCDCAQCVAEGLSPVKMMKDGHPPPYQTLVNQRRLKLELAGELESTYAVVRAAQKARETVRVLGDAGTSLPPLWSALDELRKTPPPRTAPRTDKALRQCPSFEEAWAAKEAEGYQYGADELEQVRFGWEIRESYGARTETPSPTRGPCTLLGCENMAEHCYVHSARIGTVIEAARDAWAVNDDGHRCSPDGDECPWCVLRDALDKLAVPTGSEVT